MLRSLSAMLCFIAVTVSAIPTARDAPARTATEVKATEVKALNDQIVDVVSKQLNAVSPGHELAALSQPGDVRGLKETAPPPATFTSKGGNGLGYSWAGPANPATLLAWQTPIDQSADELNMSTVYTAKIGPRWEDARAFELAYGKVHGTSVTDGNRYLPKQTPYSLCLASV